MNAKRDANDALRFQTARRPDASDQSESLFRCLEVYCDSGTMKTTGSMEITGMKKLLQQSVA